MKVLHPQRKRWVQFSFGPNWISLRGSEPEPSHVSWILDAFDDSLIQSLNKLVPTSAAGSSA